MGVCDVGEKFIRLFFFRGINFPMLHLTKFSIRMVCCIRQVRSEGALSQFKINVRLCIKGSSLNCRGETMNVFANQRRRVVEVAILNPQGLGLIGQLDGQCEVL